MFFPKARFFRNGVTDKFRASPFLIAGYLLYSLASYAIFAPLFWFFFFKNLRRLRMEKPDESSDTVE